MEVDEANFCCSSKTAKKIPFIVKNVGEMETDNSHLTVFYFLCVTD